MSRFLWIMAIVCVAMLQVGCLVTVRNRGPNPILIDFDFDPVFQSPAPLAPGFNRTFVFVNVAEIDGLDCTVTDTVTNRVNSQGIEPDELKQNVVLEWDGQFVDIVP
jgi:hypothetical protein